VQATLTNVLDLTATNGLMTLLRGHHGWLRRPEKKKKCWRELSGSNSTTGRTAASDHASSSTGETGNCCTFNNTVLSECHKIERNQSTLMIDAEDVLRLAPVNLEKVLSNVSSKVPGSCQDKRVRNKTKTM